MYALYNLYILFTVLERGRDSVSKRMLLFWVMTMCRFIGRYQSFSPKLETVFFSKTLIPCTASQHRRTSSPSSGPLWEPYISEEIPVPCGEVIHQCLKGNGARSKTLQCPASQLREVSVPEVGMIPNTLHG